MIWQKKRNIAIGWATLGRVIVDGRGINRRQEQRRVKNKKNLPKKSKQKRKSTILNANKSSRHVCENYTCRRKITCRWLSQSSTPLSTKSHIDRSHEEKISQKNMSKINQNKCKSWREMPYLFAVYENTRRNESLIKSKARNDFYTIIILPVLYLYRARRTRFQ